jgi:hypothetical protein
MNRNTMLRFLYGAVADRKILRGDGMIRSFIPFAVSNPLLTSPPAVARAFTPLLLTAVMLTSLASGQTPSVSISSASCDDPVFYDFAGHISGTASGPVGAILKVGTYGGSGTVGVNRAFTCGSWSWHYQYPFGGWCQNDSGSSTNWTANGQFLPPSGYFTSTWESEWGGFGIVQAGSNSASSTATISCTMTITVDGQSITVGPASISNIRNCVNQNCSDSSQPLKITTSSLPMKTAGQPFSFPLQASGGTPPYSWSVQGDNGSPPPRNYFPSAFAFSNAGVISDAASGKTAPGQFALLFSVRDSTGTTASKSLILPVTCGDPMLDKLGEEYEDYQALDVTFTLDYPPACSDFTQAARSVYFPFSGLNRPGPNTSPLYNWALIRYPLSAAAFVNSTVGLDAWIALLGFPQIINSGYRSPSQNATAGGSPTSRHMWGDAIDLQNQAHASGPPTDCNPRWPNPPSPNTTNACLTQYHKMVQAAWGNDFGVNAGAAWVEPWYPPFTCRYNCVHADWSNVRGSFQH